MPITAAIIPCRFGATRYPGKPLVDIHGKPMFWHVYQRAISAKLVDTAVVATDDERIRDACLHFDVPVLMTASEHRSGTDRAAECAASLEADYIVNVQGDEPMIDPASIDAVARAIIECGQPNVMAANACCDITVSSDALNTDVVKVVVGMNNLALAYSRLPIPYPKGAVARHTRQIGLYAFRREGIARFAALEPGPLERTESVEMYRLVEHGYGVLMVGVDDDVGIPVDTPQDLERVRELMSDNSSTP